MRSAEKEKAKQAEIKSYFFVDYDRLRGVGLEGGSRSGKTWDTCIFICEYINTFSGKTILISRDRLTRLKKTTYETLKKVWNQFYGNTKPFNQSATPIRHNGNTIFFTGINEDSMLAHGLETDLAWVNESMNCKHETVKEIIRRCNGFYILDYNPSAVKSWCFEMERVKSHRIHKSTALTNPYCPSNARIEILSYEPTHPEDRHLQEKERREHPKNIEGGTANYYMWQVYGLGIRGKSEDLIFPHYELFDEEPNGFDWTCFGGDFGTIAPTVMVQVWRKGNNLYIKELFRFYEDDAKEASKIYNVALADKIKSLNLSKSIYQAWDSADRKAVMDLQMQGISMACLARKGPESVWEGLKQMRTSNIFIHRESIELIEEFDGYVWSKNANGEFILNEKGHQIPLKKKDHGIDAARYADYFNFDKR